MVVSDMVVKPPELFNRAWEWDALTRFVTESPGFEPRLGLMYGRRRQGKSLLALALCRALGGFYWCALETESDANLTALSEAWAAYTKQPGVIRFASWNDALITLLSSNANGHGPLVVVDEAQYVIAKEPVLPSYLQQLLGPAGLGQASGGTRLLLCGSAFGEMRKLLDGQAPLRGRAVLDIVVQPFDYRTAADYWGLTANPSAAFRLHSMVGGTPAYLPLADKDTPGTDGDIDGWVIRRLLNPASSLYRDGRIAVAEDSQLGDRQLYWGLMSAVADGARRWSEIQAALGTGRGSLQHALTTCVDTTWLAKVEDPLRKNRAVYELAEPMVRFHRLVIERNQTRLAARPASEVWVDARNDVAVRIHGPHMEVLAREWLLRYATNKTTGGVVSEVGPTEVADVGQIDLVAVESTSVGGTRPLLIGEVKATTERVGAKVLDRLDATASTFFDVKKIIVSLAGFSSDLERIASRRADVELVDIHRIYHGD
jgi:uncharacterized protein